MSDDLTTDEKRWTHTLELTGGVTPGDASFDDLGPEAQHRLACEEFRQLVGEMAPLGLSPEHAAELVAVAERGDAGEQQRAYALVRHVEGPAGVPDPQTGKRAMVAAVSAHSWTPDAPRPEGPGVRTASVAEAMGRAQERARARWDHGDHAVAVFCGRDLFGLRREAEGTAS